MRQICCIHKENFKSEMQINKLKKLKKKTLKIKKKGLSQFAVASKQDVQLLIPAHTETAHKARAEHQLPHRAVEDASKLLHNAGHKHCSARTLNA